MNYENIRTLLEEEFEKAKINNEIKTQALNILAEMLENQEKFTSSEPIYTVAALAFFSLEKTGHGKNFKQLADQFDIDAKPLALKAREIIQALSFPHGEEILKKGLMLAAPEKANTPKEIPGEILKIKKNATGKDLKDKELVQLFREFKNFAELLFRDKDYMEIKHFLKLMELNLHMAGYDLKTLNLEQKFGELFVYLGFEPKKGREAEKFVSLKDRFGHFEPYTLIKLGGEQ